MRLFEIGNDFKVLLNKDWLLTIPQFKKLIHRDKGSAGDYDGRRKLQAIREFTFIYHYVDPRSPLENFELYERREKALQYADLQDVQIDHDVMEAQDEYTVLLEHSTPSLPLLRAAKGTNSKLIAYFDSIDFGEKDMKGQLVHSPMQHIKNVSMLAVLHKNIGQFEELVLNELKEQKGTRGKTSLGDREQSGQKLEFKEALRPVAKPTEDETKADREETQRLNAKAPSFMQLAQLNEVLEREEED